MNSDNNENPSHETASIYIDISKTCQDQLWKRRQIEWRTAFSLWTALAVSSAFIYRYAIRPIADPQKWIFLFVVFAMFGAIVWLHRRHLKALFISNERDLDFLNYYRDRAAWELNPNDFQVKPERPE